MIKKSMLILGISLMAISVLPANSIAGSGNKYKVTIETNTIDGVGFPDGVSFDVLFMAVGCAGSEPCGNTGGNRVFICKRRGNKKPGETAEYVFPAGTSARAVIICGTSKTVAGWNSKGWKHTHVCYNGIAENIDGQIDYTSLSNSHCEDTTTTP